MTESGHSALLQALSSGVFSLGFCAVIVLAFVLGWRYLRNERNRLAILNRYIFVKYRLGHSVDLATIASAVADDIARVEKAEDLARRQTQLDAMWKRAVRLEGSVVFWVDLLQKLGLLGTVLGLGFTLALDQARAENLLELLGMAVWTTVLGLMGSIVISWQFGRDVDVEVDAHEQNLREWRGALTQALAPDEAAKAQGKADNEAEANQ